MPSGVHHDDERALVNPDVDHDANELSRFGPNVAAAQILPGIKFNPPHSSFSPTHTLDGNSHLFHDFSRHNATDSIASVSSLASSDTDAEAIELAPLSSLVDTARAQSSVDTEPCHGRFDSIASASSYRTSTSKYEGEELGLRAAVPSYLKRADTLLASTSQNVHAELWPGTELVPSPEEEMLELGPPSTPMSPRQTRQPHRIYVPSKSHHDNDPKHIDVEADLALSPSGSGSHSPDNEHINPIETDSLLPPLKAVSQASLPLPVTAARSDTEEPRTFTLSFSHLETSFHVLGILTTLFLIIFSVWLTLANVKM